jgi:hypothetical protein
VFDHKPWHCLREYPVASEAGAEEASMSTIADDAQRISVIFDRIDDLDEVAFSFPENDDRCERLLEVADATLAEEAPIRPTVAASLLGVDERTVREWADNGVLTIATRRPKVLLDAVSVYEVSRLIRDLRGLDDPELLDDMWRGLVGLAPTGNAEKREDPAPVGRGGAAIPRPRATTEDLGIQRT